MSDALVAYAEPRLQWQALARYRPEAGLGFEKHTWMFPLGARSPAPGEALFERAGDAVLRDRRARLDDGREVPVVELVDGSSLPSLSRVALAGPMVAEVLAALLGAEDAIIHCPDLAARFSDQLGAAPESPQPGLFRLTAEQAHAAHAILQAEPGAYLLASPSLPMPLRHLRSLRALSGGAAARALAFAEFGALVSSCRWMATSLGTARHRGVGIALYGSTEVSPAVERAAAARNISIRWLDEPDAVETSRAVLEQSSLPSLPVLSALPLDPDGTLDASGYNLARLPAVGDATELALDDTAIVDLAPLGGWKRLAGVSMRGLRPLSLAPLAGMRRLGLGYIDQDTLAALPSFRALEELRLDGTPLQGLVLLSRCQALRSLELRHTRIASLEGIEALASLERLTIATPSAPAGLDRLSSLPRLRELSIHVIDRLDLCQLPPLPALERLEICGLDDRSIELASVDALARYPSLRALALRATDVKNIEWLAPLGRLTSLDMAATDVEDLSPLRSLGRLRRLSLLLVPARDLTPLAELVDLEMLDVSSVDGFPIDVLAKLSRLEELHLAGAELRTVRALPRLPSLRALDLAQTPLASLDGLEALPPLASLDISETQVEDVQQIAGQQALRRLALIGCPASDIRPLAQLEALEELDLLGTQVTNIAPLAGCAALQRLCIAGLALDDLHPLAELAGLGTLDLHGARFPDLAPIGRLASLRSLDVAGTELSSLEPLRGLARLRELRAHQLLRAVDLAPLLDTPPLALLKLSRTGLAAALEARLAARHHLVIAGE